MTHEQLAKMTPEEKRIQIAEICGWTDVTQGVGPNIDLFLGDEPERDASGKIWARTVDRPVPDYLNDLNAITSSCRETITDKVQRTVFSENLIQILNRKFDGEHRFLGATPFHVATAEASDLCDAFLLTLG